MHTDQPYGRKMVRLRVIGRRERRLAYWSQVFHPRIAFLHWWPCWLIQETCAMPSIPHDRLLVCLITISRNGCSAIKPSLTNFRRYDSLVIKSATSSK